MTSTSDKNSAEPASASSGDASTGAAVDPLSIVDFEKGDGLVAAIAQDDASGEILMVAYMNAESLRRTLELGEAVYWSRSRQKYWHKGEESGNVQRLKGIYVDCDGDALLLRVEQVGGAACHTGRRNCFFRRIDEGRIEDVGVQVFDPDEVYGK
ncbi:MAG TPA: phosphoribosyl-AMP cyclohydrolase [Deltaproteobacteria bacterium]|nr:phosphoribosyl-AMP cyclohydrolase [Deltaproteobacteria bacterium]